MPRLAPIPAAAPRDSASDTTSSTAGPGVKHSTVSVRQKSSHVCTLMEASISQSQPASQALPQIPSFTAGGSLAGLRRGRDSTVPAALPVGFAEGRDMGGSTKHLLARTGLAALLCC